MKKILAIGALIVVIAVAGALFFLYSNLDSLVKSAIERYGSEILGTSVRVSSVRIALTDGKGTIRGLRVANPEGFSSADAFRLGEITLQIEPQSVTRSPIVVPQVRIVGAESLFELGKGGSSNIDALLDNVKSYEGEGSKGGASEGGESASGSGEPPRIAIGSFVFEEAALTANLEAIGQQEVKTKLPAVRLQNIGGSRGATPDEITVKITTAFLASVTKAVSRSKAQELIDEKLGGSTGEAAKKLLKILD